MKQIAMMLAAAAMFVVAVAQAAPPVSLRAHAMVAGPDLTLGHLFDGLAPAEAAIVVARAPQPGTEVVLDAAWILRVVRAYGLSWQPGGTTAGVAIRRVTAEEAAALAAETAEALSAAIETTARPVAQPQAQAPAPAASSADEPEVTVLEVPVPARHIRAGEVIGADDVAWIDMPQTARSERWVLEAEAIVGQSARRALAAGRPVRPDALQLPIDVARGEPVTMVLRTATLSLTARGRALDDGATGERIRVVNTDSNRTVEATVLGPETVEVRLGRQTAAEVAQLR